MYDDRLKTSRLVLPPLEHGPECDTYARSLEEQIVELKSTGKTRDVLDLIRSEKHQRELEAARLEGWNAARQGAEIECDYGDIDCGQMPIHYVKFHFDTFEAWRKSVKSSVEGQKQD